jgi:hypothetical protein
MALLELGRPRAVALALALALRRGRGAMHASTRPIMGAARVQGAHPVSASWTRPLEARYDRWRGRDRSFHLLSSTRV